MNHERIEHLLCLIGLELIFTLNLLALWPSLSYCCFLGCLLFALRRQREENLLNSCRWKWMPLARLVVTWTHSSHQPEFIVYHAYKQMVLTELWCFAANPGSSDCAEAPPTTALQWFRRWRRRRSRGGGHYPALAVCPGGAWPEFSYLENINDLDLSCSKSGSLKGQPVLFPRKAFNKA